MKKKILVISVLVLMLAAGTAIAVPIDPLNTRPVAVQSGSEPSLQSLLDKTFGVGVLNANNDQSSFGMWGSTSLVFPAVLPVLMFEYAGYQANNIMGIWSGTDTEAVTKVDVFRGGADAGTTATLAWSADYSTLTITGDPTKVNVGTYTGINPFGFGFYLKPNGSLPEFFSADQLNAGTAPQMLAYNRPNSDTWIFAFEDLPYYSSDKDFNDMVFRVESIQGVPEPSTLLLLGLGLLGTAALRRKRK